ncbi:hypothetical protein GOP47_0027606 [Adiantum capillus-veneris]|nr:hypothetical protein GOP47_0027606 [Adiantum capillus-veneris]
MAPAPSSPSSHSKFSVYQNAAVASALAARSLKPTFSSFVVILMVAFISVFGLVAFISRERALMKIATERGVARSFAFLCIRIMQSAAGVMVLAAMSALCKALSLQATSDSRGLAAGVQAEHKKESAKKGDAPASLSERQQMLVGLSGGQHKRLAADVAEVFDSPVRYRPPRSSASPSKASLLVPIHTSTPTKSGRGTASSTSSWTGIDWGDTRKVSPVSNMQPPPYVCLTQNQTSPLEPQSSPWAKSVSPLLKEDIATEHKLEEFLADVDDKLVESAVKAPTTVQSLLTPPPTLRGVSIATPTSTETPSSSMKGTPVRALRISPSPQKFGPSPRKGDGDLPPPMTPEHAVEAFEKLGVNPQIEQWRDRLRQWFSKDLLNPLVLKLDLSHLQVMQAAEKLGISINVSPVGGTKLDTGTSQSRVDPPTQDWVSTFSFDDDALLHQLRVYLLQARDASPAPQPNFLVTQQPQVRPVNPVIQECLDAVSEHQRLKALMKGEWAKGLLPQSSVRADYTIQRIRELAEGTCVKKYEHLATGEMYDKIAKRWTLELPTDSHLLIYLFCALLEHPNWMLHIDPASQPSIQSANNPLFVVNLPHKERCPEKHVAVLSVAPPFLHPGACVLSVGKQNPPVFALYWEKKLQFSLQGRTALWDAVLLICYRIKTAHGGVVQGINLGSSAFNLLSVLETPEGDTLEP